MVVATPTVDLREYYEHHLLHLWRHAPFVLRITERKDRPIPVLIVKERQSAKESNGQAPTLPGLVDASPQGNLVELGRLDGAALRQCLPILRQIVGRVRNVHDIPLELQRYLTQEGFKLRLNLPLDEEAGAKLGLIFRLQGRVTASNSWRAAWPASRVRKPCTGSPAPPVLALMPTAGLSLACASCLPVI
jgi:hypothetical protein